MKYRLLRRSPRQVGTEVGEVTGTVAVRRKALVGVSMGQNLADSWASRGKTRYVAFILHCPCLTQVLQDSDAPTRAPRKGFGNAALTGGLNSLLPGDLAAAAGTPANFGKVGDAGGSFLTLRRMLY